MRTFTPSIWPYVLIGLFTVISMAGSWTLFRADFEEKSEYQTAATYQRLDRIADSAASGSGNTLYAMVKLAEAEVQGELLQKAYAELQTGSPGLYMELLTSSWHKLLNIHNTAYQIRLLDTDGNEQIRVTENQPQGMGAAREGLQYKGDRAYFKEAMSTPAPIYVSRLDLNVEQGRVESPLRPVFRVTAKFNVGGELRGLLVINFDQRELFSKLDSLLQRNVWLINDAGYYLYGPSRDQEWGWQLDRPDANFAVQHPLLWAERNSAEWHSDDTLKAKLQPVHRTQEPERLGVAVGSEQLYWVVLEPEVLTHLLEEARLEWVLKVSAASLLILLTAIYLVCMTARLSREVERARTAEQRASEATRAKSDFLARMSHEIRTPINGLMGYLQLLEGENLTRRPAQFVREGLTSLRLLSRIIDDILDFSKIEAGKMELVSLPFNLDDVLRDVGNMMSRSAAGKGIGLWFDMDPNRPRSVVGDGLRLRQILFNLAANAIKFTDKGEVVIRVEVLAETTDRIHLGFEVSDTGIGISREQQARLFVPFQQAARAVHSVYGGTGLGLVICKQLVELMEGAIQLRSEPGEGTTILFNIWLQRGETGTDIGAINEKSIDLQAMILSDSINASAIIRRQCSVLGWSSSCYQDYVDLERALEQIHTDRRHLLLLIDKSVYEREPETKVALENWLLANRPRVPVTLLIINHNDLEYGEGRLGVYEGTVSKPFTPSTLYDVVATSLHTREQAGGVTASAQADGGKPGVSESRPWKPLGCHVLLAEDNPVNVIVARELLQRMGATVEVASNGRQAVDMLLQEREKPFDIVLMDMQMPEMDGVEATLEIRQHDALKELPIIALTANALQESRERCLAAGMQNHLTKPFERQALYDLIVRYVKSK